MSEVRKHVPSKLKSRKEIRQCKYTLKETGANVRYFWKWGIPKQICWRPRSPLAMPPRQEDCRQMLSSVLVISTGNQEPQFTLLAGTRTTARELSCPKGPGSLFLAALTQPLLRGEQRAVRGSVGPLLRSLTRRPPYTPASLSICFP